MRRIWTAVLLAALSACSGSPDAGPATAPITKPTVPPPPPPPPDPVVLEKPKFLLLTGEKFDLAARASNPSGNSLTWSSSDPTVATVENGLVTARGFGVASISVTPFGGKATESRVWVANPVPVFANSVQGCPTVAETLFVSAAIPYMDMSGDSSSVCPATSGTVAMPLTRARTIRVLVAAAGIKFGALPWSPTSTSLFEWLVFDSKILGIHFTRLTNAQGACCENLATPSGLQWGIILVDPFVSSLRLEPAKYAATDAATYLSLLVHESRHIVYGAHKCYGEFNSKDQNLAQLGPYAAQYYLAIAESSHPAFSSTEQAFFRLFAKNTLASFCDSQQG